MLSVNHFNLIPVPGLSLSFAGKETAEPRKSFDVVTKRKKII
jgi:hypothetical protein